MRLTHKAKTRAERRMRRHLRVRKKIVGSAERPRLVVYRSLKHVYAQLVDDNRCATLASASDLTKEFEREGEGKIGTAFSVGKLLSQRAQKIGIRAVVFDRDGYPYHGRVKAVADGARDGGLEF